MSQALWTVIAIYLAGINLMACILWSHDKSRAVRGAQRIPEKTLLTLAMLGAWPASLLMAHLVRHKRRKDSFMVKLYLVIGMNLGALMVILLWAQPI